MKRSLSLAELNDREAIRELLARYCYLHTAHDFGAIAELFTEDGCFESLAGPCIGRAAIRDYYLRLFPGTATAPDRKHFVSEILIALQGEEAKVTSQFLLVRAHGAGLELAAAGRYQDAVVLQEGEWRFRHRKVLLDHRGEMGLHAGTRS